MRHAQQDYFRSFNPRPRTEGDGQAPADECRAGVSIRALARRATGVFHQALSNQLFQSAPSHGGRLKLIKFFQQFKLVSIRALARRATKSFCVISIISLFQSAPSHGGRQ